ncbi:GNAT family N-acetyltransferase [Ornithinibacillus halotolerans]|uniref:N-acetyltransferase domain-containing protein n=1 Tax=Ornithinibacillus halotolerans TaxID=1274357 RepID=A0A916S7M0_9BACI|nr:GNAT family N-acetyltransferase [Ornithinibacillus halotolerans]GGA85496.1 hypothetical protein GCM10008025_30630 [Ornithinibacillus halotolerans]
MSIHVRLATEKDAEQLSRLNQLFNGGEAVSPEKIKESMKNSNELIVVAIVDEKIMGFSCAQVFSSFCYDELQGEITEMYVHEGVRRQGLASLMINLLEEKLAECNAKHVKILTGKQNKAAIKTYTKNGYQLEEDVLLEKKL